MQHSARRDIYVVLGILAGFLVPALGARIRHQRQYRTPPNTGLLLTGGRRPASIGEGIHDIEKALQAVLLRARSDSTADDAAISDNVEVLFEITEEMFGKIKDFHSQQQALLESECKLLSGCTTTMRGNIRLAALSNQVLKAKTTQHGSCRKEEATLAAQQDQCLVLQGAQQKLKDAACSALADYEAEVGQEARHQAAMDKLPGEDTETYLDRLGRRYCDKGGLLYEFNQKQEACANATSSVGDTAVGCTATGTAHGAKKATCDSVQREMAEAACDQVSMETEACRTYGTCRVQTFQAYKLTKVSSDSDAKDRQAEWKVLMRIDCMLEAISENPKKIDEEAIKECKNLTQFSSDHLKMNYTCNTDKVPCSVTQTYPGTTLYTNLLKDLPPTAPAMPVQRCTGVAPSDVRKPVEDGGTAAQYKYYRLNVPKGSSSQKFLCIAEWAMYRDGEKINTPATECGVGPCTRVSSTMPKWATSYAFDNNLGQDHAWCANMTYGWISYEFALPMPVDRMQVNFWKPAYAVNGTWTVDASRDGRNWATLRSIVVGNGKDNRRLGTYDYDVTGLRAAEIAPGKTANFTLEVWTSPKLGAATATGAEYQMNVGGEWTKKDILCYMAQRGQPCRKQMELSTWPSEVRLIARGSGRWGIAKAVLAKQGGQARVLLDSPAGQVYVVGSRFWLDGTVKSMAVMSLAVPQATSKAGLSPTSIRTAISLCTCDMSINKGIDHVYVDGVDATSKVTGDLSNWGVRHELTFQCGRSTVLAVSGSGAGCNGGGFALKCTSTDKASPWHELIADRSWKAFGGQCVNPPCRYTKGFKNTIKGTPAGWYLPSFDDSGWKNAAKGHTNYVQATVGTPWDICSPDGPGWLFRSAVHRTK
mmetsp:Transcript_67312/g.132780  ORF Transcript_67312/g.132780 Transcript_67312/m.132780 type:complete len:875 (+) Transcript_67312:69-2693(+)